MRSVRVGSETVRQDWTVEDIDHAKNFAPPRFQHCMAFDDIAVEAKRAKLSTSLFDTELDCFFVQLACIDGIWYAAAKPTKERVEGAEKQLTYVYFQSQKDRKLYMQEHCIQYSISHPPIQLYLHDQLWTTRNVDREDTKSFIANEILSNRDKRERQNMDVMIEYVPGSVPAVEPYILPLIFDKSMYAISTYNGKIIYRPILTVMSFNHIEPKDGIRVLFIPNSPHIINMLKNNKLN